MIDSDFSVRFNAAVEELNSLKLLTPLETAGRPISILIREFFSMISDVSKEVEMKLPDSIVDIFNEIVDKELNKPEFAQTKPEPKQDKKISGGTRILELVVENPRRKIPQIVEILKNEGYSISEGSIEVQVYQIRKILLYLKSQGKLVLTEVWKLEGVNEASGK